LKVLPKLSNRFISLWYYDTPLKILRKDSESNVDYSKRWDVWHIEQAYIKHCKKKMSGN